MAYEAWSVIAGEQPTESKWNILGTNDADFNTRVSQLEADKSLNSNSDGSTVTFDLSVSKLHTVTLLGDRTLALQNVELGKAFAVRIVQGSGGGHNPTWWDGIKWPFGVEPDLSSAEAGQVDLFTFICTAEGEYDGSHSMQSLAEPS